MVAASKKNTYDTKEKKKREAREADKKSLPGQTTTRAS